MPGESIRVTRSVSIPRSEIELRFSRSSGPGGQHAQKTETRAEALFDVATSVGLTEAQKRRVIAKAGPVLRAVAQDERSQPRSQSPQPRQPHGTIIFRRLQQTLAYASTSRTAFPR